MIVGRSRFITLFGIDGACAETQGFCQAYREEKAGIAACLTAVKVIYPVVSLSDKETYSDSPVFRFCRNRMEYFDRRYLNGADRRRGTAGRVDRVQVRSNVTIRSR